MTLTKDDLKKSMRIDEDADDQLIEKYLTAAEIAVKNPIAAAESFYAQPDVQELYEVAVLSLAGTYYEQRVSLSTEQTYDVDPVSKSIVGVLQAKAAVLAGDVDG